VTDGNGVRPGQKAEPDVLLHVPTVHVGKIELKVEDLEANVRLNAQVLDLVHIQVGADVSLGKVELTIEDVEVQALLKVRLDAVETIVGDVVDLLRERPELLRDLTAGVGQAVEEVGEGAGEGVKGIGSGVEETGKAVKGATKK
jgi:hypothetical protein